MTAKIGARKAGRMTYTALKVLCLTDLYVVSNSSNWNNSCEYGQFWHEKGDSLVLKLHHFPPAYRGFLFIFTFTMLSPQDPAPQKEKM